MRKRLMVILLVLCAMPLGAAPAGAQKYPAATGYVTDTVGVLNAPTKDALTKLIRALHDKTTAQVAVAVVDTTEGVSIEEYAVKLFSKWGIGTDKKDNGVLLLVAVKDRKMRIEVGYGLEGALNDAKCGRIRDVYITPKFKAGDMQGGIVDGVKLIVDEIAKEYNLKFSDLGVATSTFAAAAAGAPAKPASSSSSSDSPISFIIIFGLVVAVIIIIAIFGKGGESGDSSGGGWSGSSSDSSDSFSSSDSFGGGDSGGGGASGDW